MVTGDPSQIIVTETFPLLASYIRSNIESIHWEMDQTLGLLFYIFESFQVDYQNGRHFANISLFNCLFLLFACTAVPGIDRAQLLALKQLIKAILNSYFPVLFETLLEQAALFLFFVSEHAALQEGLVLDHVSANFEHGGRVFLIENDLQFELPAQFSGLLVLHVVIVLGRVQAVLEDEFSQGRVLVFREWTPFA